MTRHDTPTGLVGLNPRDPIGCHANVAIKGKNGAPAFKGRWWITSQLTHSAEFTTGSGKTYRQLARDLHPSFVAWNEAALALGNDISRKGPGRLGMLRGNLVHARFEDAAFWNRAAQKLPEGHNNPPSRRPACEGTGVWAQRFVEVGHDGQEIFQRIACPNRECVFAQQGLCKVSAHLIFRLRWAEDDPFERQFPSLLCEWTTRGFESAENMLGLFEMVLGTEPLLVEEQRKLATEEERSKWKTGMAQEMGIAKPSLVGLPFVAMVGDKTKAADASSAHGKRYPVVKFSPDGDLVEWLLVQGRRRRELVSIGVDRLSLPPASVRDADFLEITRHESRLEIDLRAIETIPPEPGAPGLDPSDGPAEVSGSGVVLPSQEEGVSVEGGGEVLSTSDNTEPPTAHAPSAIISTASAVVTDAAPEVAPGPPGQRLLFPARVAELKKLCAQSGKSFDELQNHFGPLNELPADRDGSVVAWIKAKGKRS